MTLKIGQHLAMLWARRLQFPGVLCDNVTLCAENLTRSAAAGYMADFRFFKMAAVRPLGLVLRAFGQPTTSISWSLSLCKIWLETWNRCSSFHTMPVVMFCEFGLKMPVYSRPFLGGFWEFDPRRWDRISTSLAKGVPDAPDRPTVMIAGQIAVPSATALQPTVYKSS